MFLTFFYARREKIYDFFTKWCRQHKDYTALFLNGCENNLYKTLDEIWKETDVELPLKSCTLIVIYYGHFETLKWLYENTDYVKSNLDLCLKIACERAKPEIVEFLLEKGANPVVGLRHATTGNIMGILNRFENKKENKGSF